MMMTGRCLCGSVTWNIGAFQWMSHCHCTRCRKAHGAPYATYAAGAAQTFRMEGAEHVVKWESHPGGYRCFCGRCGSVVPSDAVGQLQFVPAGNFDGDPIVRPGVHIFVGSKPAWYDITDKLPQFAEYPPGVPVPIVESAKPVDPPGKTRGSCLCGGVAFVVEGEHVRCWNCHCSRCQRAKSAAFATNLITRADGVRFTRGQELLTDYKVPDAKHFTVTFCSTCGSPMPRVDRARDLAIIPMGSLDDDPGTRPAAHIFTASKAPWETITDALPQYADYPS